MTTGVDTSSGAGLRAGFRAVRAIARPDSPWPGMLTRAPDGDAVLVVDADELGSDWCGWDADPSGHLLAPRDVLRRGGGHDVILPVCPERTAAFIERRAGADAPLEAGEIVTVAVSLIRGVLDYRSRSTQAACVGQWWLTGDGRPVMATDAPGDACAEAAHVLGRMAQDANGSLRSILDDASAVVGITRDLERQIHHLEARLFGAADALPLAMNSFSPVLVRRLTDRGGVSIEPAPARSQGGWLRGLAAHVDVDLADLVSLTSTSLWRRLRQRPSSGRGRPLLVAAAAAAVILGAGLLWPTGSDQPAVAEQASRAPVTRSAEDHDASTGSSAAAPAEAVPAVIATDTPDRGGAPEWERATTDLLTRRTACESDLGCLGEVLDDARADIPPGVIDRAADDRRVVMLDSFGDAAVLRVDAVDADAPSQLVVVVRVDDTVLLRDVSDIAEQKP